MTSVAVSERLRLEILKARARGVRQYQIARQAGIHPVVMSTLINSMTPIRPDDSRIVRIGEVLGVPAAECFDELTSVG